MGQRPSDAVANVSNVVECFTRLAKVNEESEEKRDHSHETSQNQFPIHVIGQKTFFPSEHSIKDLPRLYSTKEPRSLSEEMRFDDMEPIF